MRTTSRATTLSSVMHAAQVLRKINKYNHPMLAGALARDLPPPPPPASSSRPPLLIIILVDPPSLPSSSAPRSPPSLSPSPLLSLPLPSPSPLGGGCAREGSPAPPAPPRSAAGLPGTSWAPAPSSPSSLLRSSPGCVRPSRSPLLAPWRGRRPRAGGLLTFEGWRCLAPQLPGAAWAPGGTPSLSGAGVRAPLALGRPPAEALSFPPGPSPPPRARCARTSLSPWGLQVCAHLSLPPPDP